MQDDTSQARAVQLTVPQADAGEVRLGITRRGDVVSITMRAVGASAAFVENIDMSVESARRLADALDQFLSAKAAGGENVHC